MNRHNPAITHVRRVRKLSWPFAAPLAALLVVCLIRTGQSAAPTAPIAPDLQNVKMYCWIGEGTGGLFGHSEGDAKFDDFFLRAVKVPTTKIVLRPGKQVILAGIKDADLIYANVHAGCIENGTPRMIIKTGTNDGPDNEITAKELQDLYETADHLPTLVIITGCNTLAKCGDDDNALKLNAALHIDDDAKGRAYIGFKQKVTGGCGDAFFRIFLSQWTHAPYPTLEEARKKTLAFFSGDLPKDQKFLDPGASVLPGCPPKEIGTMMSIVGDEKLTFAQVVSPTECYARLKSADSNVKEEAITRLGQIRDKKAVDPLIQVLTDDKAGVTRAIAAEALGRIGQTRAVEPLIKSLDDKDWAVRGSAARALGMLKDPKAVGPLLRMMKSEIHTDRLTAATALGRIKDKRAVDALKLATEDKSGDVRKAATEALKSLSEP